MAARSTHSLTKTDGPPFRNHSSGFRSYLHVEGASYGLRKRLSGTFTLFLCSCRGLSARGRKKKRNKRTTTTTKNQEEDTTPSPSSFHISLQCHPKWLFPPRASSSKGSIWKLNEAKPKMVPTGWCLSPGGGGRRGV
ncbi:hypothetical protein CEXT_596391 [Caerostris extrusa]|uniref:Uncharacterized protein n=1 Tax=Caerostris extrusa TaxID=172846 RepID=A0AAV4TKT5_CAEEX|nr:hypothetical protein CEXT_596391 [Caerostris extrusa]